MSEYAEELRELVASVVPDGTSAAGPDGVREAWESLSGLGLPRIGVPEEREGSGGVLEDLLVVVAALAARGVGVPVVESSVADWVISHERPLDDSPATLVLSDGPPTAWDDMGGGTLTGEIPLVPWARDAALLVVCQPGLEALVVDLRHASVSVVPVENLAGEPRDTVLLDGTPALPVAAGPGYEAVRARLALLWSTAVAGAAHGAYLLTKTYVCERRQFGAPLTRLPAVSSGLAQMKVHLLQADAALALAREAMTAGGPNAAGTGPRVADAVAVARLTTARTATEVARTAHQLHGAMGITQEYPLHHLTRRLWAWRDAVAGERDWADELGRRAADLGEAGVWTRLTMGPF
ncbi:acyl-CoA dehydrogenase family protein [Streptomyces sp. VNUA24]|uniref:acyl-CoA dehydrogenase family protein n=1 Tax=Streptomyces sp. VNUA24 TaxID=3031131 RepID=UPI0023B85590|nr:acyl-CoA dehydrogenase family protein [Streptomyces sp. VNUA24]WEH12907.1 acyl-CoA dehydrogenase family protein [Streptomyces sp. VNUA24]